MIKVCRQCKKKFKTTSIKKNYCCRDCYKKYALQKFYKIIKCPCCEKKITVLKNSRDKFCNKKCYLNYLASRHKKPKPIKKKKPKKIVVVNRGRPKQKKKIIRMSSAKKLCLEIKGLKLKCCLCNKKATGFLNTQPYCSEHFKSEKNK